MLTAPSMIITSGSSLYELVEDAVAAYHCPYTTVEFAEPLATHEQIRKIHNSAKEVFVRSMRPSLRSQRSISHYEGRKWAHRCGKSACRPLASRLDFLITEINLKSDKFD
jgi:hypothetical protein